ncbi:MAG: WD40 repeat domain-containing protein [Armatimonas sp.]
MVSTISPLQWLLWLVGAVFLWWGLSWAIMQRKFFGTNVRDFVFSPDGRTLYGGGGSYISPREEYGWIWAWDVATGRLLWRNKVETFLMTITLSPDGASLLTEGGPGITFREGECSWGGARLWNTDTGELRFPLMDERHNGFTKNVFFTPDGRRLLGCFQEGIQIWEAQTGEPLDFWPVPKNKTGWPARLQFSADGTRMLVQASAWPTGGTEELGNAFVQLWDAHTGAVLQDFPTNTFAFGTLSPNADWIAVTFSRILPEDAKGNVYAIHWLELYALNGQKLSQSPELPLYTCPESLSFLPDGNVLCRGTYSHVGEFTRKQVFLWDTGTNQISEQPASSNGVLSADGRLQAVINEGGYRHRPPLGTIYRVDTGEKLCDLEGFAGR